MRVEIVTVGTELLLGQIVDTNSGWIAAELAAAGFDVLHTSCVGDNISRIASELRMALARADAVVVTGGLGPTQDDLTREAIATVLGVPLVEDPALAQRIRERFEARGRAMSANNLRQAQLPVGAVALNVQPGTAPGLRCELDDRLLFALPGVPAEMRAMLTGSVLPHLRERAGLRGETAVLLSRELRTWGLAESRVAELLDDRVQALDDSDDPASPTIAFLASGERGITVRLTVRAAERSSAEAALAVEEALVRAQLEPWVYGVDEQTLQSVVIDQLRAAGWSVATAESLTAGYLSGRLATVPGASDVLRGGVVGYASEVKQTVLAVPAGPVVTEQAALAMARGVARLLGSDTAVATTGVAGPDLQEGQPVGTVCLAVVTPHTERSSTLRFGDTDRETIRQLAVTSALDLLRRELAN